MTLWDLKVISGLPTYGNLSKEYVPFNLEQFGMGEPLRNEENEMYK